jgi:hypothetical protein
MQKLNRWVLHPLLIGSYAVLALLAYNIGEIDPVYAVRPLLLSVALAGTLLLFFRLLLHDWRRAALAASLWVLLFVSYGHVHSIVLGLTGEDALISSHGTLLPIAIALGILGVWLAARTKSIDAWTRALNVLGLVLVGFCVLQLGLYRVNASMAAAAESDRANPAQELGLSLPPGQIPPDVYYIILDTYPRADALAVAFGYDNSWFVEQLEQRGFTIPDCSESNYSFTANSLTSSLNMDYLPKVVPAITSQTKDTTILYPALEHGKVRGILESLGYKTVAVETGYSPTEWQDADYYLAPGQSLLRVLTGGLTPFETLVLQSNMGTLLYDFRHHLPSRFGVLLDGAYVAHRNRILYVLGALEKEVPALPGPKFVFVHILAPHNPFVFGPQGEILDRKTPFTLNNDLDALKPEDYIHGFRDQVNYLDQRTLDVIDSIISQSETAPIIIIQGDHGSPRTADWKMAILNAYKLPRDGASQLYPSISPVNSFRVVFDAYFGGSLGVLPDQQCLSNPRVSPFVCEPRPDPNPACAQLSQP